MDGFRELILVICMGLLGRMIGQWIRSSRKKKEQDSVTAPPAVQVSRSPSGDIPLGGGSESLPPQYRAATTAP